MWSIFENVPCAFEKNMYFASLGGKGLYIYIYQLLPCDLAYCSMLQYLCWYFVWIQKSPTIIVLLSISFLMSSEIFLMCLCAPMLGSFILTMFMSSWWILLLSIMKCPSVSLFMTFILKSILSYISMLPQLFFFFFHLLGIFFLSLTFQTV